MYKHYAYFFLFFSHNNFFTLKQTLRWPRSSFVPNTITLLFGTNIRRSRPFPSISASVFVRLNDGFFFFCPGSGSGGVYRRRRGLRPGARSAILYGRKSPEIDNRARRRPKKVYKKRKHEKNSKKIAHGTVAFTPGLRTLVGGRPVRLQRICRFRVYRKRDGILRRDSWKTVSDPGSSADCTANLNKKKNTKKIILKPTRRQYFFLCFHEKPSGIQGNVSVQPSVRLKVPTGANKFRAFFETFFSFFF